METKLNLHQDSFITLIQSHTKGTVRVRNLEYTSSIIVTPEQVISWPITNLNALNNDSFPDLFELDYQPELVILGTGDTLIFPQPEQTSVLIKKAIGLEVMDTAAACRTYNILADDGRKVVAYLII